MGFALNGVTTGYNVCAVYPRFKESITVTKNSYSYQVYGLKKHTVWADCYEKLGSYFKNAAKFYAENGLFAKRNSLRRNYIYFDSKAKILLEQPENLNKLKEALRRAKLY